MKTRFGIVGRIALVVLLASICANAEDPVPQNKKHSVNQKKAAPRVEDQIQALQQQVENLSRQVNSLTQALTERDVKLQEAERKASEAQATADKADATAANERAAVADNAAAVSTLQTTVNNVKTYSTALAAAQLNETNKLRKETDKVKKEVASRSFAFQYKGITFTPGGFIEADTIYRSKATASDTPTPFNNIPYQGDNRYKLSEFYGSARATRLSLLIEAKPKWGALRGYYEVDFQGAGTNSNNNQTNSYALRQRLLYGEAEMNNGWKFAFGQMWSLATEGDKGIPTHPSGIMNPPTIDTNYMPGFVYTRQYGLRVVRRAAGGKFTFGAAAENPQLIYAASLAGNTPYAVLGSAGNATGYNAAISGVSTTTFVKNYVPAVNQVASAGYLPVYGTVTAASNIANYSFNAAPDLLVKAVADPGWGHYELFGIIRFAHETIYPGVTTDSLKYGGQFNITCPSTVGTCSPVAPVPDPTRTIDDHIVLGGIGASFRLPVVRNKFSFGAKALYGPGVGRYGASTLPDVTTNASGGLAPIHNLSGLLSLQWTPTKRLTLWANYGGDYAARADYSTNNTVGLSDPTPCYGGFNPDQVCISPSDMNAATLAANTGTWGSYWNPPIVQAVGYGSRAAINNWVTNNVPSGCNVPAAPGFNGTSTGFYASVPANCVGHTRNVQEFTGGYFYDIFKGEFGRLRQGIQYGYVVREGWSGQALFGVKGEAKGIDNMFWTSFRYYLP